MKKEIENRYIRWCGRAVLDPDLQEELSLIAPDDAAIEDAFYRELEFGTAGLRGVIGAGTNRMNVYTVGKATQGLADYLKEKSAGKVCSVAVSYDSRIKSELFARTAAAVLAENGCQVYIYASLMPVPCLSYATRALGCDAGIMITASHNPSRYNGYKVYGADGCQITSEAADLILQKIGQTDEFRDIRFGDFESLMGEGKIAWIPEQVYTDFIAEVKNQSVLAADSDIDKNVAIVYTPLNGSGLKPVTRALKESGYTNITLVAEQQLPDGNFPTCPYPNPEIREAMALGMQYAKENQAELLIATDPDCDRVGIAASDRDGEYVLLTGNETGCLLLDYICSQRVKNGTMPAQPVMVKTIVTTDLAQRIADRYGVRTVNVLTGFKFIGEQIALLEKEGRASDYILGFEESYGYLSGSYVRDKDAVNASFLIAEMFAYYKSQGIGLLDKLDKLYREYGYTLNTLYSFQFEGIEGAQKMNDLMAAFRGGIESFGSKKVEELLDYSKGIDGLPKADVLKFMLTDHASVVVRPSGTEPKIKIYISVTGKDKEDAKTQEQELIDVIRPFLS